MLSTTWAGMVTVKNRTTKATKAAVVRAQKDTNLSRYRKDDLKPRKVWFEVSERRKANEQE